MLMAVALDWWLAEPRRWHPLVGFGRFAGWVERQFYRDQRIRGVLAVMLTVIPITLLAVWLSALSLVGGLWSIGLLYLTLGHKSLHQHARPVAQALAAGDEVTARYCVSQLVSRDAATLKVSAATVESVLENGNDGVFGALFWFAVAGAPGAVAFRLVNTLDAMWGYRNERYQRFGWAAARLDDLLGYLPARLTALTYGVVSGGHWRRALVCWRKQAPAWDSPNAGPVMAAGAGALGVTLGGPARYAKVWHQRPLLGVGQAPEGRHIEAALRLLRRGVLLWLGVWIVFNWLLRIWFHA